MAGPALLLNAVTLSMKAHHRGSFLVGLRRPCRKTGRRPCSRGEPPTSTPPIKSALEINVRLLLNPPPLYPDNIPRLLFELSGVFLPALEFGLSVKERQFHDSDWP